LRARFIPPPSTTLKPRERASRPRIAPDSRASTILNVAASACAEGGRSPCRPAGRRRDCDAEAGVGEQKVRYAQARHALPPACELRDVGRHPLIALSGREDLCPRGRSGRSPTAAGLHHHHPRYALIPFLLAAVPCSTEDSSYGRAEGPKMSTTSCPPPILQMLRTLTEEHDRPQDSVLADGQRSRAVECAGRPSR
jgi:hypothetical protein